MLERLKEQIRRLIDSLQTSVKRFPETIILALGVVVVGVMMNHLDYQQTLQMEKLNKYLLMFILGVPLMTAGVLFSERMHFSRILRLSVDGIIAAFLVVYYVFIPEEIGSEFMIRYMLLLTSGFLAFTLVPFFINRENYSRYVLKLLTNFFITFLFSFVLYLGINAIIFTIEQLFELNIDNDIHLDTFIIIAGLFAVTHYLGHVPDVEEGVSEEYYPPVLRVLFIYIIVPLLSVYTVILYAYFVRLILQREFPINMLGHLVVWYGLISVIILFFINRIRTSNAFIEKFYNWFPIIILIPLGMLFAAIISRIADFGITPARYFVLISGLWIFGSMIYLRFSKYFRSSIIVVAAIFVLLVSGYGPQSAFGLSLANQTTRFENLLIEYDMLSSGVITPRDDLSEKEQGAINEFVQYFNRYHRFDQVEIIPEGFEYKDMKDVFGFKYAYYYPRSTRNIDYFYNREPAILDISGYDNLVEVYLDINNPFEVSKDILEIAYNQESRVMTVIYEGEVMGLFNIEQVMMDYHERRQGLQPTTIEDATIVIAEGEADIKLIINNLYYDLDDSEEIENGSIHFNMLIGY
jgi:hypothetical protein